MILQINPTTFLSAVARRALIGPVRGAASEGIQFLLRRLQSDERVPHLEWAAYILATVKHETAHTYAPIAEQARKGDPNFTCYDPGRHPLAAAMGNTQLGDGKRYRGRGYVQLTWKNNYAKQGARLGVDLVAQPERACEPEIAYDILVDGMVAGRFTGAKLGLFVLPGAAHYEEARRVVNGRDKAKPIAEYARAFEAALRDAVVPVPESIVQ